MLATVLNVGHQLARNWHLDYGITGDRNHALLAPFPERNSFNHPGSETALSLFMFGNMDGWKQLGHPNCPRNDANGWRPERFDALRDPAAQPEYQEVARWPYIDRGVFHDVTLNWRKSLLMFEFEVLNSAFHLVNGRPFRCLSFLDIGANRKWGAFDAFMAVPSIHPTENRQGVLVGFEAKLRSDISRHTTGFSYVNQVMRNLEAGYWLTHHDDSLYRNWDFWYVFVCTRQDFEMKTAFYSWMLFDGISKEQAVTKYREVLEYHHAAVDEQHFASFRQMVHDRAMVLYWDEVAEALQHEHATFWNDYLTTLQENPEGMGVLGATLQRLGSAGIVHE